MLRAISSVLIIAAASSLESKTLQSPCPEVFTYEPVESERARWYGVINLTNDVKHDSVTLNIVLDNKANILGNWFGDVTTKNNTDFKIFANKEVDVGPLKPIRFFVEYNPLLDIPKLQAIRLNGKEVCSANEPPAAATQPTVVPMIITTTSAAENEEKPAEEDPLFPVPYTGVKDVDNTFAEIIEKQQENTCGKVKIGLAPINPLVINGNVAKVGHWPWHVAMYLAKHVKTVDLSYQCGGTLVSDRHVITAGHCVTINNQILDKSTLTILLGKHNLKTSVEGVQTKYVNNIIVHPDYNGMTLSRDIAIIQLTEPATFTNRVQPACLWPEDKVDLKYVVGKYGTVVGWGLNQNGIGTEDLMELEMPVVDQLTCVRSNVFFQRYTSDYTLCAGFWKQNKSVCNGDSGGGLLFNMDETWYLRGIVSLSVSKRQGWRYLCDPDYYVVFTDVAQFLPWIKQNMV